MDIKHCVQILGFLKKNDLGSLFSTSMQKGAHEMSQGFLLLWALSVNCRHKLTHRPRLWEILSGGFLLKQGNKWAPFYFFLCVFLHYLL